MPGEIMTYVEFENRHATLRGMLHRPAKAGARVPAVVLCHGMTGHKIEAHRLFVKTSRALAAAGIASLRFDFRGSGESDGDFVDMTVSGEVSDALAAVAFMAQRRGIDRGRLGILGLSLGGMIAALVLGQSKRLRSAALWAAVARPSWRLRLSPAEMEAWRHGSRDFGGMPLAGEFLTEMERLDALGSISTSDALVLLVHGSEDQAVPLDQFRDYEKVLQARGRGRVETVLLDGADHVFSRADWESTVIERTVAWFAETLRDPGTTAQRGPSAAAP